MGCDVPVRECLYEHVRPKLAQTRMLNGGLTVRARCPTCGAHDTLTVSAGEHQRVVWSCYTRSCDGGDVRAALLLAGVPSGCLPRGKGEERSLAELALSVLRSGDRRGRAQLRAYLVLLGYRRWPGGAELVQLAGEVGVGRAEAFETRRSGPLLPASPCTTSTPGAERELSNESANTQVSELVRIGEGVRSSRQVRSTGQPKVRSTGQTLPRAAS